MAETAKKTTKKVPAKKPTAKAASAKPVVKKAAPKKETATKTVAKKVTKAAATKPDPQTVDQPVLVKAPKAKQSAPKATGHQRTLVERLHGKRYNEALALLDRDKHYSGREAVKLVKDTSKTKFDATIELHVKLGVDPRKAEENIRGTVKLPAGTGKSRKVLAFVPAAQQAAAKKAGADFIADEATIKKIKDGWTGFDVAVATPDQMPAVAKLGQTLGPKGLMPNPKAGTVSDKPAEAIAEVKQGTIEFRVAKDATLHAGIGKASFSEADLAANLMAYYKAVNAAKPKDSKGTYIRSLTLAATMGPGIKVDPASLEEA